VRRITENFSEVFKIYDNICSDIFVRSPSNARGHMQKLANSQTYAGNILSERWLQDGMVVH